MCGIAGFCRLNRDRRERERTIRAMTDCMRERGPDAEGAAFYEFGDGCDITFGHRRLAIIDLSENGQQPMDSHSGRLSIVYNGEIYGYREVREELERTGAVKAGDWRSTSDTEILLEAIEAWGVTEALKKCRGMFAIAVLDHETGDITLARDRVGEKPLYYGFVNTGATEPTFAFASDPGCFRQIPGFSNEINRGVLPAYFVHGYIPAPYTVYCGIWKLEPGTALRISAPYDFFDPAEELDRMQREDLKTSGDSGKGHSYSVFWSMKGAAKRGQENPFKGSFSEASEELERLLVNSIKGQMIADVPLGAFLSAGIDSSTIVSLMQDIAKKDGLPPVRTFTIGMNEEGFNEAPIAKEIAAHLGTEHTEKYVTKEDALAVVPKLPSMFGEPFADSSQIPTYLVSAMTREHVTVSLSGDAGDELFCGYTSYESIDRIWGKMKGIPAFIRRPAGSLILRMPGTENREVLRTKARLLGARGPVELHRLESDYDPVIDMIAPYQENAAGTLPYKLTQLDEGFMTECNRAVMLSDLILYHPDDILVKVDRCAMANSLETRVPLLDKDVVEFALTLPLEYLVEYREDADGSKKRVGKRILRDILYKRVPRELMDRPKKGFSIPVEKWLLEEPLRSWAEELMDEKRVRSEGWLNADAVRRIWKDYTERGVWRVQIWYILMFEAWIRDTAES